MEYTVTKKTLAPQPVLAMQRTIQPDGIAQALGEMFGQVFGYAGQSGAMIAGAPYARYLKMQGERDWVIEAGAPIAAPVEGKGEIYAAALPGGPAAMTTHSGDYSQLRRAHSAIHDWLVEHKIDPAGSPWESYITDPGAHPDPKDWKTEVYVPLGS